MAFLPWQFDRRRALACATLAALAGLVYLNALHNLFVYDDHRMVVENLAIQHLFDLRAIVFHDASRPMVNFSYAIDRAIWGPAPFGFHLTNVLLHMLNVVLLFIIGGQLVQDLQRRDASDATVAGRFQLIVPFTAAALFAVHPMMTEAVGYVSGRSEVLCGALMLSAFLCARQWMLRRGASWRFLSAGLWVAALATKEIAVAFPLLLLYYDRIILRADKADTRRNLRQLHGPLIAATLLFGAIRLGIFVFVEYPGGSAVHWQYLLVECDVIRRYVGLMFVPEGQSIFHAISAVTISDVRAVMGVGTVVLIGAAAWALRRSSPLASLGLFWFLLILIPSAALVVLDRGEPMAEHRVYVASCGFFLALGAAAGWMYARLPLESRRVQFACRALAVMVLISLGGRTILRNVIWGNPVALWTEARDKAPDHWLPHLLLGEALHTSDRHNEATIEYAQAIALRPEESSAYQKLGVCFIEMGHFDDAAATYQSLRRRDPQSTIASIGLGAVAMITGEVDRARDYFRETIDHDGRNVIARQSLAMLAEREPASPRDALRLCQEIREIAPDTPGNDDCIRRNQSRVADPPLK